MPDISSLLDDTDKKVRSKGAAKSSKKKVVDRRTKMPWHLGKKDRENEDKVLENEVNIDSELTNRLEETRDALASGSHSNAPEVNEDNSKNSSHIYEKISPPIEEKSGLKNPIKGSIRESKKQESEKKSVLCESAQLGSSTSNDKIQDYRIGRSSQNTSNNPFLDLFKDTLDAGINKTEGRVVYSLLNRLDSSGSIYSDWIDISIRTLSQEWQLEETQIVRAIKGLREKKILKSKKVLKRNSYMFTKLQN